MSQLPNKLVGRAAKDVPDVWTLSYGEFAAVNIKNQNVMIISRSCALDNTHRKHCLTAPVRAVATLPTQERSEGKLRALRENEIPQSFYLPEKEGLPESYADLLMLTPIHRSFFAPEKIGSHRLAKLSGAGTSALQLAMSDHFGMKFGFSEHDKCTQQGSYRCMSCFHLGNNTPLRAKRENQEFGTCEFCGDQASWVKIEG